MRVAELDLWEEAREHWLRSLLVVALLAFNLADVLTTQSVLARGGVELNPVSAWLIDAGALAHVKMAVASFIAVAAAATASSRRVSTLMAPIVAFYLIVVANNVVQLLANG